MLHLNLKNILFASQHKSLFPCFGINYVQLRTYSYAFYFSKYDIIPIRGCGNWNSIKGI